MISKKQSQSQNDAASNGGRGVVVETLGEKETMCFRSEVGVELSRARMLPLSRVVIGRERDC